MRVNPKFYRPVENEDLLGSAAKARKALGWEPKYTFEGLVEEMVLSDIELVKNGRIFSSTYLDWLVDETAITEDSGTTSGKESGWSVAGSENTDDSTIPEVEKTEDLGISDAKDLINQDHDLQDRVIDEKPLAFEEGSFVVEEKDIHAEEKHLDVQEKAVVVEDQLIHIEEEPAVVEEKPRVIDTSSAEGEVMAMA